MSIDLGKNNFSDPIGNLTNKDEIYKLYSMPVKIKSVTLNDDSLLTNTIDCLSTETLNETSEIENTNRYNFSYQIFKNLN